MSEIWKPIPEFPGYEVSNLGRVQPHQRLRNTEEPRILHASLNPQGYNVVGLARAGRRYTRKVANLVVLAFVGPRPEGDIHVRHLDGTRTNDVLVNLAYGTRSENTRDSIIHGTHNQGGKTHCKRGHEFTPENTRIRPLGGRECRTCRRTIYKPRAAGKAVSL